MKIAFIGGGNMATALIGGLFSSSHKLEKIQVGDPNPEVKSRLEGRWSLSCFNNAVDAIHGMDCIVLAVKPQILPMVLQQISASVRADQVIVSIVAGIPIKLIAKHLECSPAIIRSMPNTPALIGLGITGMYATEDCTETQKLMAEALMQAAGEVVWLQQEALLDVVTAVSGSGPAYFFYLIEAMRNAGARLGLPQDVAEKLAVHTANGASSMAVKSDVDVTELRRRVTSKGGTTQAAVEQLQNGDFAGLVDKAIAAATERGRELAANANQPGASQS